MPVWESLRRRRIRDKQPPCQGRQITCDAYLRTRLTVSETGHVCTHTISWHPGLPYPDRVIAKITPDAPARAFVRTRTWGGGRGLVYTGILFVEETDGLEPPLAVISSPRSWPSVLSLAPRAA